MSNFPICLIESQWQVAKINLVLAPLQKIPGILIEDCQSMSLRIPPVHISPHSNLFGKQLLGQLVVLLPQNHDIPFHISHLIQYSSSIPTCSSLMLSASNFLFSRANLSGQFDICALLGPPKQYKIQRYKNVENPINVWSTNQRHFASFLDTGAALFGLETCYLPKPKIL